MNVAMEDSSLICALILTKGGRGGLDRYLFNLVLPAQSPYDLTLAQSPSGLAKKKALKPLKTDETRRNVA